MESSVPSSAEDLAKPVAKFVAVQGLNYLGYLVLSPIVVAYGMLVLGLITFALIGGIAAGGEMAARFVDHLAQLDAQYGWVDWVYREELGFEGNILRLFGWVSLMWYLGAAGIDAMRTNPPEPSFARTFKWWGGFNVLLAVGLSVALISIEVATGGGAVDAGVGGGDSMLWRCIQFALIATVMVGLMFGTSLMPVALSHFLGRISNGIRTRW